MLIRITVFHIKFEFASSSSHDLSTFSLIWVVSHSTPSWSPSPVTALEAQMCQGLSMIFSSPSIWETLTEDMASRTSILLAKNRIGILRERMSWVLRNRKS